LIKRRCIRYRDTVAAHGSELYEAVVDSMESPSIEGRKLAARKARKIYKAGKRAQQKYNEVRQ
jgi:hypothetical protein